MKKEIKKEKSIILLMTSKWWHHGLKKYMEDNCIGDNDIIGSYCKNEYTIIDGKLCLKPIKKETKFDLPTQYWELSNDGIIEIEFSTECKDINGVEIFENDIVEYRLVANKGDKTQKLIRDIVIIDADIPCFRTKRLNKNTLYSFGKRLLYKNVETIKVIGNIHENPELVSNLTNNQRKDKQ